MTSLKTITSINDSLGAGKEYTHDELEKDTELYVISRSWATKFKSYVKTKLSELQCLPKKKSIKTKLMAAGGIDFLDLSGITDQGKMSSSEKADGDRAALPLEDADPTVKITCEYLLIMAKFKAFLLLFGLFIFFR